MPPLRIELLKAIDEAGKLIPSMRLCQMLVVCADKEKVINISDEKLFECVQHYIYVRKDAPPCEFEKDALKIRNRLLEVLAKFSETQPDWSVGYTLVNFAHWANRPRPWLTFHHEDSDLLRGAANPKNSVVRPSPDEWPDYAVK